MRVITGFAKGHKLISLEGSETRPTTDRVKEAMFSIIQHHTGGSIALDLFAGSGALGIEALSRNAKWCDFVDQNKTTKPIIESNLRKTRFENCEIFITNAKDYLNNCEKKYDLVFLDPPYEKGLCDVSIEILCERRLLNDGALIVCETSSKEAIASPLEMFKQSVYGTVKLTIFENR